MTNKSQIQQTNTGITAYWMGPDTSSRNAANKGMGANVRIHDGDSHTGGKAWSSDITAQQLR